MLRSIEASSRPPEGHRALSSRVAMRPARGRADPIRQPLVRRSHSEITTSEITTRRERWAAPRRIAAVEVRAYTAAMTEQPAAGAPPASPADPNAECPHCRKPRTLCVCEGIAQIDNKVSLLILQHPQEQDRELGTARLTALHFKDALLKIGLSWPSLTKILGRPTDPQRWAILYLGSVRAAAVLPDRDIVVVNKNGNAVDHQDSALREIAGVILLDGTWSQAKALWWRNGWMLKCKRVVLGPKRPSRYGKLRREPRSDGLSTLEAAAMLLARLERRPEIEAALNASFERLLARYRATRPVSGASPVSGARRRRWSRR
jgi:DTW domain-containing protein YfiP